MAHVLFKWEIITIMKKIGLGHLKIFSRTTGPILTRLGTSHPREEKLKIFSKKGIANLQGDVIAKRKNRMKSFKNLLSQNQLAKINQTSNKLSIGEGNSSLFN
jgi:hypothetical protein